MGTLATGTFGYWIDKRLDPEVVIPLTPDNTSCSIGDVHVGASVICLLLLQTSRRESTTRLAGTDKKTSIQS